MLPQEIWIQILHYLSPEELLVVQETCSEMYLLCNMAPVWHKFKTFDLLSSSLDTVAQMLQKFRLAINCTQLRIPLPPVCNSVEFLLDMRHLEELVLLGYAQVADENCSVTGQHLTDIIRQCTTLRSLALSYFRVIHESHLSEIVKALPQLKQLKTDSQCRSQTLAEILQCSNIRSIVVEPCGSVEEWASLINTWCGIVCFGHDIVDYVPRQLLAYDRSSYSRPSWQ